MEFSLLIAAAIAVAAACGTARLQRRPDCDLIVTAVVAGIATGRLWAMVASGTNPVTHPVDILIVRGGVDTFAATAGALAAAAWSARADLLARLDALAAPALMGLAGWHVSCLARTTCLGTSTGLPWGWPADSGGVDRHPVELYAAMFFVLAAVGAVVVWRRFDRRRSGVLAALALAAAAAIRALTEPMRPVIGGGLTVDYLVAAGVLTTAAILLWRGPRLSADS